ncbi:CinA family protein [bacterium]|nr:CinA family protein [bacterium]MBU0900210.1 CinA family protein [bacterium]MBU1152412.1 CinA family protein [bacterium]MBU1782314.1 CinA family protein [bacterium]
MKDLVKKIAKKLLNNHLTIAVAESCTGGLLCYQLTKISGSSNYFKCGYIVYSNESKTNILSIPEKMIKEYGAVSKEIALSMAKETWEKSSADLGISLTGIAGPMGGSLQKPVGLVYIALVGLKKKLCQEYNFQGSRREIRSQATQKALEMILETLD